jgi:hypothetical protein
MTICINAFESSFDERRIVARDYTSVVILMILAGSFGFSTIVAIPAMYRSSFFTNPLSSDEVASTIPNIDLGRVNGFVTSSDGLPMSGAIVHVYKHMGLIDSADKNPGYSISVITKSDGSYSFGDLPSGVYKFTVTYSDDVVQTIDNYAVWPSSSSSYIFKEYRSSTDPLSYDEVAPALPNIDLGRVNGFVRSSDDLPVDGASVAVYKHTGLIDSADMNAGYSTSAITEPDGSYSFDGLPSGVYKFIVTYPDSTIQTIDNYAVWPSSSSSYVFKE